MLDKKFLDKNYYLNAISKFLLNSYGTEARFDIYFKILLNLDDMADDIFKRLDIFNVGGWNDNLNYFTRNNIDPYGTEDAWLDIIASIYNINRNMNISYLDALDADSDSDDTELINETITLDNYELYMYIKVMISKLNFSGMAEDIIKLYGKGIPGNNSYEINYFGILYLWSSQSQASLTCSVIFNNPELIDNFKNRTGHQNIVKLFLADYLLIESLGITYNKYLGQTLVYATFYDDNTNTGSVFYDNNQDPIYIFN